MNNKKDLAGSKSAGCYCCCKIFESKEVINFTDKGATGLCPFCSCDCVVGDSVHAIDENTLKKAKSLWIGD